MEEYVKKFYLNDLGLEATDEELKEYGKDLTTIYHEVMKGKHPSIRIHVILQSTGMLKLMKQRGIDIKLYDKPLAEKDFVKNFDQQLNSVKGLSAIVSRSIERLR